MKVLELEEGKKYKDNEGVLYKKTDGYLYYKDADMLSFRPIDFTEYTPPTDWSKVEVDTKVLVRNCRGQWYRRYFARYEQDKVYVYADGVTSWSDCGSDHVTTWDEVKLYTEE